jgi:hypothetical protein
MRLLTCTGCKFAGSCDHAAQLRAALKGHGVRTIKFACAKRESVLSPGQAAIFTTFTTTDDGFRDGFGDRLEVSYPGVVIEQRGGKVWGFIKPGTPEHGGEEYPFEPKGNGYVKMPLARVRVDASRPSVPLKQCRWCASYYEIDGRCDRDRNYTPNGDCLASPPNP